MPGFPDPDGYPVLLGQPYFNPGATPTWFFIATVIGTPGTWIPLAQITGAVTLLDTLSVVGAATFQDILTANGLVLAAGGVEIPGAQTLRGPVGQDWLTNGIQSMDPILHAARHEPGGQDPIAGLGGTLRTDQLIETPGLIVITAFAPAEQVIDTSTPNIAMGGRAADSTVIIQYTVSMSDASGNWSGELRLYRINDIGETLIKTWDLTKVKDVSADTTYPTFTFVDNQATAREDTRYQFRGTSINTPSSFEFVFRAMLILDFGTI